MIMYINEKGIGAQGPWGGFVSLFSDSFEFILRYRVICFSARLCTVSVGGLCDAFRTTLSPLHHTWIQTQWSYWQATDGHVVPEYQYFVTWAVVKPCWLNPTAGRYAAATAWFQRRMFQFFAGKNDKIQMDVRRRTCRDSQLKWSDNAYGDWPKRWLYHSFSHIFPTKQDLLINICCQ